MEVVGSEGMSQPVTAAEEEPVVDVPLEDVAVDVVDLIEFWTLDFPGNPTRPVLLLPVLLPVPTILDREELDAVVWRPPTTLPAELDDAELEDVERKLGSVPGFDGPVPSGILVGAVA